MVSQELGARSAGRVLRVVTEQLKQVRVGDNPGLIKVIDLTQNPPGAVATINTGGVNRAGEIAYDPKDGVVVVANDADSLPCLTFISTTAPYGRRDRRADPPF